ncbi:MAG: hypothetical protein NTX49_08985 [Chlamydiae bacterium]|nr:hypothetical protein [Chlamydiota bacterium]
MASSVSSAVTNISTCRVIQEGLGQLGRVRPGNFPSALTIIRQLGTSFAAIDSLTPVSKGRIAFLGNRLLGLLDGYASREAPYEVIAKVIADLANLKNALQMEVANFSWIYHPIQTYSQLSRSPYLRELQEILPEVLHKIRLGDRDHFVIDAEPIQRYFASVDTHGLTNQFDLLMIILMSDYKFEGSKITIPLSKIPRMDLLERYLGIEDIPCKLVIQMLYACGLQYSLISNHLTSNDLVQASLFNVLEKIEPSSTAKPIAAGVLAGVPVEYSFNNYLEKKPLIPLFSAILEERDLYMAEGTPTINMMVSEDFISRITPMMGEDWLQESAEAYDLIRRIEISCRKIFPRGLLGDLDELLRTQASDPYLLDRIIFMNHELAIWKGRGASLISPDLLHSGSKEDYKLLAFYQFMKIHAKDTDMDKAEAEAKSEKDEVFSVKIPSSKKDPRKGKKPAKAQRQGGAGSTSLAATSALEDDAGAAKAPDPVKMKPPAAEVAHLLHPTGNPFLTEAISKSRASLSRTSLAPRVNVWNISGDRGLAYYGYGLRTEHVLSPEEMILRHRFPPGILSLLFSDLYSKESTIQRPSGEICRHFESVLYIDGKKYMLEATADSRGTLFHYYARPLTRFADYFQLTRESPSEFPVLKGKAEAPTPLAGVSTEGIRSDPQGNATFEFDGHTYKILLLRMP